MPKFNTANRIGGNKFECVPDVTARFKKMTGTRFGKVLGLNHWSTPFQAWCEICKVAEPPFEGNKYTEAGQYIEPKLIQFARDTVSPYILTPEGWYGDNKKRYDFFPDNPIYGGMWDGLAFETQVIDESDMSSAWAIVECKTTSRPQDWEYGVPDHYKAQALLYAVLVGCEHIIFPVAFLTPEDYDNPQDFECTDENTRIYEMDLSEPLGDFHNIYDAMAYANVWWGNHVDTLLSPECDPRKDKEYLEIIGTCDLSELHFSDEEEMNLTEMCDAMAKLDEAIEEAKAKVGIAELEAQRKKLNSKIQSEIKPMLDGKPDSDQVEISKYIFKVGYTKKTDYDKMEEDGVIDDYVTYVPRITTKRKEN